MPAGEYQWVQGQPDWLQPILNAAVTGTPDDILLLGGQAMDVGYRQPFQDVKLEARTYQTQLVGIVNQVAGILGVFEPEDVYAMATLAASCLEDVTGFDPKNLDVVPDGFGDLDGFVGAMMTCVISLAQNPDLAISTLDEVLRGAGTSAADRGKFLGSIRGRVDRLAPLAKKVAAVLNVAGATIRAWDGIWDNVNEGLLTVNLTGTEEAEEYDENGIRPSTPRIGNGTYGPLKVGMSLAQAKATGWLGPEQDNCADLLGGGAEPGEYQYGFADPANPGPVGPEGSVDFYDDKIIEIRVSAATIVFADGAIIARPSDGTEFAPYLNSVGYDVELTQMFEPYDRLDGTAPDGSTFGTYLGEGEILVGVPQLSLCD